MSIRWLALPAVALVILAAGSGGADDKAAAEFVGRVEPAATVDLRSRVNGAIVAVHCKAGDEVKQGDLLFEIDPRPYQAELDRAMGGVGPAEARLRFYVAELERAKHLRPTGGITQGEYDRLVAERANSEGMIQTARAAVEAAKVYLDYTRIVAPMRGRVSHPLAAGNVVRENRNVLATLVADDPVTVAVGVDEKTALRLLKGKGTGGPATVGFADETGFPHEARVEAVGVQADPATGTVQVRVVVPNPGRRVLPGMSARVRLTP
ncbi:MAG TPA: efflux RND transporter periplasmic adaptor subunit [Gemmataceae bacterium]|jgi:multidrug efflux system membrane fusion protein